MKADAEIRLDVMAELAWDPVVRPNQVGVAVNDGVVTLTGHLDTYAQKWAVERAVQRVKGVKAVALELDVRLAHDHVRSDTDIAIAAENALRWHALVPAESVRVTVNHGQVTVDGEVDWDYQRESVLHALRHLKGVQSLTNHVTLRRKPPPQDLQSRIREALTRRAEREARHIDILIDNHTVTLKGQVDSLQDRDAIQGAVWGAPGVTTIINEITVAPQA
jgi:osmotically-inducible protein OsmY